MFALQKSNINSLSRWLMLALAVSTLVACASSQSIRHAINSYDAEKQRISLGQSRQHVLDILEPTQAQLSSRQRKEPEQYMENGKRMDIHFYRSRSFADGLVTDDEFVPYVFADDVLVAIGWTAIGGPKTQAQPRQNEPDVYFHYGHHLHY